MNEADQSRFVSATDDQASSLAPHVSGAVRLVFDEEDAAGLARNNPHLSGTRVKPSCAGGRAAAMTANGAPCCSFFRRQSTRPPRSSIAWATNTD